MKKKSLSIFLSSLLMISIIIFASSMLIAAVKQACDKMPGCYDSYECDATFWRAAPDCYIDCVKETYYCEAPI